MLEWFKKPKINITPEQFKKAVDECCADSADIQIQQLWEHHNRLSKVVADMSELLKKLAIAAAQLREDLDFLGHQTMRIGEQQNKLVAQIMRNEELISDDKMKSTRLH